MTEPSYDIVVRCKDEFGWLDRFLDAVMGQTHQPEKIIFVDSGSTDGSLEWAQSNNLSVVEYPADQTFNYSKALNIGISESTAEACLFISAHCILASKYCAQTLLRNFCGRPEVAGVFGRQLPTFNSTALDTRDLVTVFGREKLIYHKHPFFHNAFSAVRRDLVQVDGFDESVNGVEDRHWARSMCTKGYKIIYEPDARVFHEHGLNQAGCEERARRVCRALSPLHADDDFEFPVFAE